VSDHYDVIIIGTGAGGGTLAHRLGPSGKRILLLERGGYLPREPENWSSEEVFLKGRYLPDEQWLDKDGNRFTPHQQYFVGGNTKFYGAILFRLRERDFHQVRHHGGVSPAWPISYEDLAPYYDEAEALYHVHGERGEDPTEPPAAGPFPWPAVAHEPRIQRLHDDLARKGLHPFHLPVGITGNCVQCDRFDGFPCALDGKADAHVLCVRPTLEQHKNVELRRHAKVERLESDGSSVTRVVLDSGQAFSADVVVVSCGAINSAALLLRSGLANSSGVVGRHYMCHINSAMLSISKEPNPTRFQKTLGFNDFYADSGDADFPHPLGHIQMLAKSDRAILRGGAPRVVPGFALDYVARHAVDFWLTTEDLPQPGNRVTLERDGTIRVSYGNKNLEPHRRLIRKLKHLLPHLGMHPHLVSNELARDKRIPLEGVAHQCGTVRFGTDPKTSALDVDCKAHELDNLYVVDTSFFPSSAAVNPALTAMANALRVGDHLLDRLGARVREEVAA
jgi:choline dehydrogenase-like flavoprotein